MNRSQPLFLPDLPCDTATTAQEHAYQRLRHALMVGVLAPGRSVTIRGLSQALALSPTPVREALRRLSSENALHVLENRRIRVPVMTAQRLADLVDVRSLLECHAATGAMPYVNDVLVQALQDLDADIERVIERGGFGETVLLNQRFHETLYRAGPERVVLPMIHSVWLQLGPFLGVLARHLPNVYRVDRHREILDALRERDPPAVRRALDADVRESVRHIDAPMLDELLREAPATG